MDLYKQYIKNHISSLETLSLALDEINGSNSDNDLSKLKKIVLQVAKEKEYIRNNFAAEKISEFNEQLSFFIKQINKKFDNIWKVIKINRLNLRGNLSS